MFLKIIFKEVRKLSKKRSKWRYWSRNKIEINEYHREISATQRDNFEESPKISNKFNRKKKIINVNQDKNINLPKFIKIYVNHTRLPNIVKPKKTRRYRINKH